MCWKGLFRTGEKLEWTRADTYRDLAVLALPQPLMSAW